MPQAEIARTYLVFFDWDRADLTDRARQIIAQAAQATTRTQVTRIEVDGNTDTTGTARYNQGLSVRRAENVAAELVRDGVPRSAITTQGFGFSRLLVPTGPGVREPQNRRVEIILPLTLQPPPASEPEGTRSCSPGRLPRSGQARNPPPSSGTA